MRKNKIRLNESQLRQVIKESVKKVLSEIDWRTLDKAKDKAFHKDNKQYMNFVDGIMDALNKKFFDGQDEKAYFPNGGSFADGKYGILPSVRKKSISYGPGDEFDNSPVMGHGHSVLQGGFKMPANYEDILGAFNGDEDKAQNFFNMCKEYYNHRKGKSNYTKGKGWD